MTRGEMMDRMSHPEFVGWQLFWELEPFGEEWLQAATPAAAMGGGDPKKYIPYPKPPQTAEEMEAVLMSGLSGLPKATP